MRVLVSHVFANRDNNKTLDELKKWSKESVDKMIAKLEEFPFIRISNRRSKILYWNSTDYEEGTFGKSFDDIRTSFTITKNGRTHITWNDIYAMINSVKIGYFDTINN